MELSAFAHKFSSQSGILALMDDMAKAIAEAGSSEQAVLMLGGGNPDHIPAVNKVWRQRMQQILDNGNEFERMLTNYDTPRGRQEFLTAIAEALRQRYGWNIDERNIAVTNGSQSAFFYLFNIFAGRYRDGTVRHVLFPLMPEYIGYADQSRFEHDLLGLPAKIQELPNRRFKYQVDFLALQQHFVEQSKRKPVAALCVSRPTNPSGNVLTDTEMSQLASIAKTNEIPLFVDNAYGLPFPGIVFCEAKPYWDQHVVLSMSLSKLGLPSTRTGIIVARPELIQLISNINAVVSLSCGSIGQALTLPMIRDGSIFSLAKNTIAPYYQKKSQLMQAFLDRELNAHRIDYRLHLSEGAFFLWIFLPGFPVDAHQIYQRLKSLGMIVVPGSYFFYGLEGQNKSWLREHGSRCLRLSFARGTEELQEAAHLLASTLSTILVEQQS